jgi:two-component system sensor histidine kinase DctS
MKRRIDRLWNRWSLWLVLLLLLVLVLSMLVWLAGRYEANEVQNRLEHDTADVVGDIRNGLARNVQSLQALQAHAPTQAVWRERAAAFLADHRELLRLEWRSPELSTRAFVESPFHPPAFAVLGRSNAQADVSLACATANRFNSIAYSGSYFLLQRDNLGMEVLDLCIPLVGNASAHDYVVVTYSLSEILSGLVSRQLTRNQELSFTEVDGTRLTLRGLAHRGSTVFTARQLLDLPGNTLVVRMDSWRNAPGLFPNLLTALVVLMSLALISVTGLLARDTQRRRRAERGLADALAFRKAMEDSLLTGLRARDLSGRITYVNPAFCQMVGFSAAELRGHHQPPYWPPELAQEYQRRHDIRHADGGPPREGYHSVFMRKDGSRFPVLVIEAALINAQNMQTGWMSTVVDVTEQRRIEELSRASQERLQATARLATMGEMASMLSHELNQPLAAISSYAIGSLNLLQAGEHAATDLVDLDGLAMAMGRIAEQAERAGRVIQSIHDFVRRRAEARVAAAPQSLLDAIMPLMELQARKLRVVLVCALDPALPPVLCDRTMVEQVLLNLARNAMQAMDQPDISDRQLVLRVVPAGPPLRAAHAAGWLEFSVADVGPGIPDAVAERLFTPFFTTKQEGMGLGLSLCRTVVEQHGGFLDFYANQPQGTVFRFTLPLAPTP